MICGGGCGDFGLLGAIADSQETGRGHDVENISTFDLFDSFLPQYKIAFAGGASGAMCCAWHATTMLRLDQSAQTVCDQCSSRSSERSADSVICTFQPTTLPWVDRPARTVTSSTRLCERIGTFLTHSSRQTAVLSSICVAFLHMHRRMRQPQRGELPHMIIMIRFALETRRT